MGLSDLSENLAYLDTLLDDVLLGKKLYLDPENSKEKLFIDYLHALYPDDFDQVMYRSLDTRAEGYYITPKQVEAGQAPRVEEINTRVHPLHDDFSKTNHVIAGRASKVHLYNFVVAGADLHYRDQRDYEGLYERSPNLMLHAKGDAVSLSQSIKLLRNIVEGKDKGERALLIDNSTERFSSVLKILGLEYQEAVDNLNDIFERNSVPARLAVVEDKNTAIGRMKAIAFEAEKKLSPLPQIVPDQVFQATSSQEKIEDIKRAVTDHRSFMDIRDAKVIGGQSEHDPEFQFTFAGNNFAKALLTIEDKQQNPHVDGALHSMGVEREDTGVLFYDGGEFYAERGLRDTDAFEAYLNQSLPLAEFPGADTKPVSQSVGTNADYYKVVEKGLSEISAKEERDVDARIADNCVVIYMPLEQVDMKTPRYYAYKAMTMQDLEFHPDPMISANAISPEFKTQRHYQKPLGRVETLAELEEENDPWMNKELAIAKAIRGFSDAGRVPRRKVDLKADFDKVKDTVVHCPHPIPEEDEAKFRQKFAKAGLQFSVRKDQMRSIADVRDTVNSSSALFFPNIIKGRDDYFWTNRVFTPASAVVDNQLSGVQLPVTFLRDANKLTEFERMANHYKRANMVAQDVRHLYRGADKIRKNANYIKERLLFREDYDEFTTHKKIALPKRKNAVVFLESASSTHPVDLQNSYELPVNCGLNGFDNVSGSGVSGPMGMVSWAGLQLRREGWLNHVVMGAQDKNAMKTEGAPFEPLRLIMGEGYGVISPDIFERMWQMLQIDELQKDPTMEVIAVAQGCGIGGLQEISFIMALKELGIPGADRIHLIIENAERDLPNGAVAPHDELLDIMEKRGDLSAKNKVYATSNPYETLMKIGEIQNKKMIYVPIQNPVETIYPFEELKNPLYAWLMDRGSWNSSSPTIREAVNDSSHNFDFDGIHVG